MTAPAEQVARERLYGPLPLAAEVERFRFAIKRPMEMKRHPGLFPNEAAAIRWELTTAETQVEYSVECAPEQVDHWLWVVEAERRELQAVTT